ncbi:MAG: hypothetical protein ABIK48_08515 [candidate division WOR-3 bacterium]
MRYYISINPQPEPVNLTAPYWKATVLAVSAPDTTAIEPPPEFTEVTVTQLHSMGYPTPEESYNEAAAQGYGVEYETDGLDKKSWINVAKLGDWYQVQYGSATGRNPWPGQLGLGCRSYYNGILLEDGPAPGQFYETNGWYTSHYHNYLAPAGDGVEVGRHHWGNRNQPQYTEVRRRWP